MKNNRHLKSHFILSLILLMVHVAVSENTSVFSQFITVKGDQLMEGDKPFRFISFNIPNLLCIEDNMVFPEKNAWRLPDLFEIEDALKSAKQAGGTVIRTYVISVRRSDDMQGLIRYVEGPGQFNEDAFRTMDQVLATANEVGIRLIIPIVDNWKWMGGKPQYAEFRGKHENEFWTDPQIREDFKKTIHYVLNRKNTITGVTYKEDKSILAWELGNEIRHAEPGWILEMAEYMKRIDSNHLINDGIQAHFIPDFILENPWIDVLSTHHYEHDPADMLEHIRQSAVKARGRKPYYVGEFGFVSTTAIRRVLDYIRQDNAVSGALIWSLRFHNRDGGFYWHSEPMGGGLYKAYHWPGFESGESYDEKALLKLMSEYGHAIQGIEAGLQGIPAPPVLLPIDDVSGISWQGSVGADNYMVERAEGPAGPWVIAGENVSDAAAAYVPLFHDSGAEIGRQYYYRVKAVNAAGFSVTSNTVGPVLVERQFLVDEMKNFGILYHQKGEIHLETGSSRTFKEDFHRIRGKKGSCLIYYVPGSMEYFRIHTHSREGNINLQISGSQNGSDFTPLSVKNTNYFAGALDYGYWQPVLHEGGAAFPGTRFIKLEFQDEVQIGRIEISYGK